MSKSDRIHVSREVLDVMRAAVTETRDALHDQFPSDPFEQGALLARLASKMLDIQIALDALCKPQS